MKLLAVSGYMLLALGLSAVAATAQVAGKVDGLAGSSLYGDVSAKNLYVGDQVHMGETLTTGQRTDADILFNDATTLKISENSAVKITELYYNPSAPADGSMALDMAKGVFRFSSGKLRKDRYRLSTPVSSIGIRGTDFTVIVTPGNGETFVIHHSGVVNITNLTGASSTVSTPGYAVRVPPVIDGTQEPPSAPVPFAQIVPIQYQTMIRADVGNGPIMIRQADAETDLTRGRILQGDDGGLPGGTSTEQAGVPRLDIDQINPLADGDSGSGRLIDPSNTIELKRGAGSRLVYGVDGKDNVMRITMGDGVQGSAEITGDQNRIDLSIADRSRFDLIQTGDRNDISSLGPVTLMEGPEGQRSVLSQTGSGNVVSFGAGSAGFFDVTQSGAENRVSVGAGFQGGSVSIRQTGSQNSVALGGRVNSITIQQEN